MDVAQKSMVLGIKFYNQSISSPRLHLEFMTEVAGKPFRVTGEVHRLLALIYTTLKIQRVRML